MDAQGLCFAVKTWASALRTLVIISISIVADDGLALGEHQAGVGLGGVVIQFV